MNAADEWASQDFAQRWDTAHVEMNPARAVQLPLLVSCFEAAYGDGVVDPGVGSGLVAELLLEAGATHVVGIDSSDGMLDVAR
jgi:ubiquinone/menaquinone biosynthesis C-methylase UbiE